MARDAEFRARITADDQASQTIEEIAAAADKLDGKDATVAVAADDEATDVLEGATEAVETLDGDDATVGVAADDEATPTLEEVQGATDALDGADASVAVSADDQASGTLDDVAGVVAELDSAQAEIAVGADDQASGTLGDIQSAVDALDGATAEVTATVDDEATATLDDVQSAVDELDGSTAEVTATVDDQASDGLGSLGSSFDGLTTKMELLPGALGEASGLIGGLSAGTAGAAAGIGAIAAAVGTSISSFEELNIAIGDFVTATGTSFDEASRLIEVTGDIGIGADTVEKAISKMNLAAGKTPAAFDKIGASIVHASDGTINVTETFLGVVDALGKIDDAQARTEAGRAIFGNGWRAMAPLIRESADEVRASLAAVDDTKIGSAEKTAEADAIRAALDSISDATDNLKNTLGESLAPAFAPLAQSIGDMVTALAPLIELFGGALADEMEAVTPLFEAIGKAISFFSNLELPGWLSGLGSLFESIVNPVGAFLDKFNEVRNILGSTPELSGKVGDGFKSVADQAKAASDEAKAHAEAMKAVQQSYADAATHLQEWTDDLASQFLKVGEASVAMTDLGSALDQIGIRQDVLGNIFKLDDGPRNAASQVRDIADAIGGLGDLAKGVKVGDVLANDVKADKFLDAIDKLAPQVQSAITTAFGSGGPEAATAMANSYIDQVTKELGGKFTREQVADMLGLSNIEATIAVAVEQSSVEVAKRQLAILTGLGGQTPYTASIALALDAGTITGEQAQTLIQAKLGDVGVDIPASLQAPDTDAAIADAQAALDGKPAVMTVDGDTAKAKDKSDEAKKYADSLTGIETVDGNNATARAEAAAAKAYADSLVGTVGIDGNSAEAQAKAAAAKAYTDSLTGTEAITGDNTDAKADAAAAKAYADSLSGKIAVNGDNSGAINATNAAKQHADSTTGTITITANIQRVQNALRGLSGTVTAGGSSVAPAVSTMAAPTASTAWAAPTPVIHLPAPVVNVAAPVLPPIVVKLDGRPIAALIGSTTAPAVRAAAMTIRAGRA